MDEPVWAFIVSIGLSSAMLLSGPLLLKLPRQLRHSWFYGLWASVFCLILIVSPFFFMKLYHVIPWAFLGLIFWLLSFGRRYPKMIVDDLRQHLRDGRTLFEHQAGCHESRIKD